VVAYPSSENANAPEKIDVLVYDPAAKQWNVVHTLDPHEGTSAQPYLPSDNSCQGECVRTGQLTDGGIDFVVEGGNSTLANGLTVVSFRNGTWRMVPFLDKPPSSGSTNYVPAATVVNSTVHVDINDCQPDCATGGHQSAVYTYSGDQQAFVGAIGDGPAASSTATDAGPVVAVTSFRSPSGNILCGQNAGQVMCFLNEYDFTVPGTCDIGQPGLTFILNASGPAGVSNCANDISIKYSKEAGVVPYGTTADLGVATCKVTEQGVVCTNADGHGLSLAKAAWSQF
jgi:hypothetical protein